VYEFRADRGQEVDLLDWRRISRKRAFEKTEELSRLVAERPAKQPSSVLQILSSLTDCGR
jgi:hypothetical protein